MKKLSSLLLAAALGTNLLVAEQSFSFEDLDLSQAFCGWQTLQVNKSVTKTPLKVAGKTFARGVGTHAPSQIYIPLGTGALRIETDCGIDDDTGPAASVEFRIWADGKILTQTPVIHQTDGLQHLTADLRGAKLCILEVSDGGDGMNYDHANWINMALWYEDGKQPLKGQTVFTPQLGILTPKSAPAPRINGAAVVGVRPGHPLIWRLPVTGERPLQLAAENLPAGLTFDAATQVLSGSLAAPGDYPIRFTARNAHGNAERTVTVKVGDTISLTPAMGWNSWNCHTGNVSDEKVRRAADAMLASGLADHGWQYIVIDDYWQNKPGAKEPDLTGPERLADGSIAVNKRFPDMKALTDYLHAKGFKAGLYSSPGPYTCGGCTGSYGHELQDAQTYAQWGFDFLKYDFCSYSQVAYGEKDWRIMYPYWIMGRALKKQNRDILFSLCEYGMENVSSWGNMVYGQSWRTTGDVFDSWQSIYHAIEHQKRLFVYSQPGSWNDPDMLCVGKMVWNGFKGSRLTHNEQYTHISLWALLPSPLMIGCDMTQLDDFTLSLLTNDEVIDINQDPLGAGAAVIAEGVDWEIWARPLADGSIAAGLFNKSLFEQVVTLDMEKLGMECKWKIRDAWTQQDVGVFMGKYETSVPGHATHLVRITPLPCGKLRSGLMDIRDNAWELLMKKDGRPSRP